MSLVGKKFPSIAVDAMSEMGDNLKINIFEEAVNNNKKVLLFFRLFIFHELRISVGSIWMITHSFFSSFTKFILESVVAGQESILVERYVSSQ